MKKETTLETKSLQLVEQLALDKQTVYRQSRFRYLLRAMLASMFIGFGVIVAFRTGNYFFLEQSSWAYPMAAITFGAAIILIVYGGGDLATGDTFYFTYAALRKKLRWPIAIRMWLLSYGGNIIGAALFALLIWTTGLFDDPSVNGFLLKVASGKVEAPVMELFFRGILCNWLVCMAFFVPMNLQGDGPKLFAMVLFVFCFFISGYEHSIANMCTFAISLVLNQPDSVTLGGVVYNLIPVTIGNIIGGGVFMAYMYHYVNKPFYEKG